MKIGALAAAAVVSLWAMNASAATVQLIYSGKIAEFDDVSGNFGRPGTIQDDVAFSDVTTYDNVTLDLGGSLLATGTSPTVDITIGGVEHSFVGQTLAPFPFLTVAYDPLQSGFVVTADGATGGEDFGADFKETFLILGSSGDVQNGKVSVPTSFQSGPINLDDATFGTLFFGSDPPSAAYVNDVEVSLPASLSLPVPEPSTWIMMIAGFGLLGLQLRRGVTCHNKDYMDLRSIESQSAQG